MGITNDDSLNRWLEAQLTALEVEEDRSVNDRYVDVLVNHLVEIGTLTSPSRASHPHQIFIDWDEDRRILVLIAGTQSALDDANSLALAMMPLADFLTSSVAGSFPDDEAAQIVKSLEREINGIEIIMAPVAVHTDRSPIQTTVAGHPALVSVWGIDRAYSAFSPDDAATEEFVLPVAVELPDVDVERYGLSALGPFRADEHEAWVTVVPGDLLADLYEAHGQQLLELNVRSFLQTRGKVNAGIQATLSSEPARFLAYNNGLSITAHEVTRGPDGTLSLIAGMQIVNGGQTTASLHHAKYRQGAPLADVQVQVKITVVDKVARTELAPKVAQFANAQNPVRMADFSSNSRFHLALEVLSKQTATRSGAYWYYERSTGRYADDLMRATVTGHGEAFRTAHPTNRKLNKLDVAKLELAWRQDPHLAALGGQKASAHYMQEVAESHAALPNERFFTDLIGLAILWKQVERVAVGLGAYRAQVAAYTVALLSHKTAQRLDLDTLWTEQFVSDELATLIEQVAPLVRSAIVAGAGTRNVTEWAKKPECWESIKDVDLGVPDSLLRTRATQGIAVRKGTVASSSLPMSELSVAKIARITAFGSEPWFALAAWAADTDNLTTYQRKFAFDMGRRVSRGSDFTERQGEYAARILDEAERLGFISQ